MQIIFQPTVNFGPAPAALTLVDDQASPRVAGIIEEFGGDATVQLESLYAAANKAQFARGNVSGLFSFTAGQSFGSLADMLWFLGAQYALLNMSGTLTVTEGVTVLTFAEVIVKGVKRVDSERGLVGGAAHVQYNDGGFNAGPKPSPRSLARGIRGRTQKNGNSTEDNEGNEGAIF